ncbi:SMODS domain-containing nucleotidyltransferase [Clostridium sp.]|uniref:SMODS domain-containing nucleotidyltransferase n=1 Tax=Clostridium sp. TaxID=1506 RepID=UPI0026267993|nr:nucleotidyltransferase [uncultured Clostridium sp.]
MTQKMTTYFSDFLKEIRLTENQVSELKSAHETLRRRLKEDEDLSNCIVETFLQGSYKRSTAVRPKNGKRSDVDIIIVTNLDKDVVTTEEALDKFEPFLEKYYSGKFQKQGRSWGIEMSHVDLDVVPTSAPSEIVEEVIENNFITSAVDIEYKTMDESYKEYGFLHKKNLNEAFTMFEKSDTDVTWKNEPLYIPDHEADNWDKTHPLEQIRWTIDKNCNCNGHYVNIVKAIKWWRKEKYPEVKHPKSYPLEHFIGNCCPDGIESVAEGITLTLEKIVSDYTIKPFLGDRGVTEHDVFGRLGVDEYDDFYATVKEAAPIARKAYDADTIEEAATEWRKLFGNKFPEPPKRSLGNQFTQRKEDSRNIEGGRFA